MYQLIPIVSEKVIYNASLKVRKEDSKQIIKNIEILSQNSEVEVKFKEVDNNVKFEINSFDRNKLEIFFFKISSIANDSYIRNSKSKK